VKAGHENLEPEAVAVHLNNIAEEGDTGKISPQTNQKESAFALQPGTNMSKADG